MELSQIAQNLYNRQSVSSLELKQSKAQNIKNVLNISFEICDLFSSELTSSMTQKDFFNNIENSLQNKKTEPVSLFKLTKMPGAIIDEEHKQLDTNDMGSFASSAAEASIEKTILKFNSAMNDLFGVLTEKEKNAVGVVMFDYLWRKCAVDSYIAPEERPDFPKGEPLLKYEYYQKIYKAKIENQELPNVVELKMFLGKKIIGQHLENADNFPNLDPAQYRSNFVDGQSRYYALNLNDYILVPISDENKIARINSFTADPISYIFDGKIELPQSKTDQKLIV